MKILLIEDERSLAESIIDYLKGEGYICEHVGSFNSGEEKILLYEYDCILVDITLPGGTGLDLVRTIKMNKPRTGLIIISAKNSIDDKITGLDLGADDYLTKPFNLAELNSRIKSILRRKQFDGKPNLIFNEIVLNFDAKSLVIKGAPVNLTKKEYDLLLFFITNKDRVLTKEIIAEHLWGDDMDMSSSFDFIYTHIKNLRKKMMANGGEDYIKTVYGEGYKFTDT